MLLRRLLTLTPVVDTAIYASGDVLCIPTEIPNGFIDSSLAALLKSVVVLDASNSKAAIDILFFDQAPVNSIGALNAAYALNDADLPKLMGRVSVVGADYVSSSTNNAEASIKNIDLMISSKAKSRSLFIVIVSRGTPTYGTASDLTLKLGIES